MKKYLIYFLIGLITVLTSCQLEKRHYRKGFYFHSRQEGKLVSEENENSSQVKVGSEQDSIIGGLDVIEKNDSSSLRFNSNLHNNLENDPNTIVSNNITPEKIVLENNESHTFQSVGSKSDVITDKPNDKYEDEYSKMAKISFYLLLAFLSMMLFYIITFYLGIVIPGGLSSVFALLNFLIFLASIIFSINALRKGSKDDPNRKYAIITLSFWSLVFIVGGILMIKFLRASI